MNTSRSVIQIRVKHVVLICSVHKVQMVTLVILFQKVMLRLRHSKRVKKSVQNLVLIGRGAFNPVKTIPTVALIRK